MEKIYIQPYAFHRVLKWGLGKIQNNMMKVDKDKSKRRKNIQGQHELKEAKLDIVIQKKMGLRNIYFWNKGCYNVKGPSQQQHVKIQKLPAPNRDSKYIKQNDETT